MLSLKPTEKHAWHGFLLTHDVLWKRLEVELAKDDLNLPTYELLTLLQDADAGIRMSELASSLRFSGGGLTRLVDKLEKKGFLLRQRCPEDGRGFEVLLTPLGRQKLKRIHAKHLRNVRSQFLDKLSAEEVALLANIWQRFEVNDETRT